MIAELGLAALWLAAALALAQAVVSFAPQSGAEAIRPRALAVAQGLLCLFAFTALVWLFASTDLSVLLVAQNSALDKPMLYKIAGAWGNHEGSMLLWVTVLTFAGGAIALLEHRLDEPTLRATLGAQALLSLGFFGYILLASNPFTRLDPAPAAGMGLNPLLQDPGLAFHPPTLYIGYVGLSVAFSFAVGAMLTGRVGPAFARAMRPWVLASWIMLTIGIVAGSYWAYYELGWGGWWFWDPVENASLMPWLAATALLHSVAVLAARDALRGWTIMLALIGFAMSIVGTFLVRSGILTSVHAFAVDPERGGFILALMALYVGGALILFALRIGAVKQGTLFEPVSREAALVGNNILLTVILAIVLIGTLYPLMVEAAVGEKISVGPPYFDAATVPIAFLLMLLLVPGALLRWRQDRLPRIARPVAVAAGAGLAAVVAIALLGGGGLLPSAGLVLAAALAVAAWMPLRGRRLGHVPLATWGMMLAHFGLAVSVAGMAAERGWSVERLAAMRVGDSAEVAGWTVTLRAVDPVVGPNWTAVEAAMDVGRGDAAFTLHPQSRSFAGQGMTTAESALATRIDGQLYVVVGGAADDGRWQVRLWWKPFVTLIWWGGLLVALGGALALGGRMLRPARLWWRARRPAVSVQSGYAR